MQNAQPGQFTEHFEEPAIIQFAPSSPRAWSDSTAGTGRGRQLARIHADEPTHVQAGWLRDALDAAPIGSGALQAKSDGLAEIPAGRRACEPVCSLPSRHDAGVRQQCRRGIVSKSGSPRISRLSSTPAYSKIQQSRSLPAEGERVDVVVQSGSRTDSIYRDQSTREWMGRQKVTEFSHARFLGRMDRRKQARKAKQEKTGLT